MRTNINPRHYTPQGQPVLNYGYIVHGVASKTNIRRLDSIHNAGLRLALWAFCTSPVSSMCVGQRSSWGERRLKLSMHCYMTARACTDNPTHRALHEFHPQEICIFLGLIEKEEWPKPDPTRWCQDRGLHEFCWDWHRNGLAPGDTKLPAWNTWIWSEEKQLLWRGG